MTTAMFQLPVLDKGFVNLESMMGGDAAVLNAARVSYRSSSKGEEADRKLIAYLIKNDHGSPFEHAIFTFHVKLPIFVARQWIRHRTSSYNEVSARYTEMREEFYYPKVWRAQDIKNKQGSVAANLNHAYCTSLLDAASLSAVERYKLLLSQGVAKEMARFVLPVNLYTEWIWTPNARALMNFLTLRCEDHAQWETRQYAYSLAFIMSKTMPWAFQAWVDTIPEHKRPGYGGMFEEIAKIQRECVVL